MKNALIIILIGIIIGLSFYIWKTKNMTNKVPAEIKQEPIATYPVPEDAKLNTESPFFYFHEAEEQIIEKIKKTQLYKDDTEGLEPYAIMRFRNTGFRNNGFWYYGQISYDNVYKEDGSDIRVEGKPLSTIMGSFNYIIRFNGTGNPEIVTIDDTTEAKTWNENLEKLPGTLLRNSKKPYFMVPTE